MKVWKVRVLEKVHFKDVSWCVVKEVGSYFCIEGNWIAWKEVCLVKPITYDCSVTLKPLSERVPPIWFDEMKDWSSSISGTLRYPVAKCDKTCLHWGLISYNKNIVKASAIKNALKLQVWYSHRTIVSALQFSIISIQTLLSTVSQEYVYCNWN